MILKDEKDNIWYGRFTTEEIKQIKNSVQYVWFDGIDNCGWHTPHYVHRLTIDEFLSKAIDKDNIYILPKNGDSSAFPGPTIKSHQGGS